MNILKSFFAAVAVWRIASMMTLYERQIPLVWRIVRWAWAAALCAAAFAACSYFVAFGLSYWPF